MLSLFVGPREIITSLQINLIFKHIIISHFDFLYLRYDYNPNYKFK